MLCSRIHADLKTSERARQKSTRATSITDENLARARENTALNKFRFALNKSRDSRWRRTMPKWGVNSLLPPPPLYARESQSALCPRKEKEKEKKEKEEKEKRKKGRKKPWWKSNYTWRVCLPKDFPGSSRGRSRNYGAPHNFRRGGIPGGRRNEQEATLNRCFAGGTRQEIRTECACIHNGNYPAGPAVRAAGTSQGVQWRTYRHQLWCQGLRWWVEEAAVFLSFNSYIISLDRAREVYEVGEWSEIPRERDNGKVR
jgi:hypothetical protein